MSEIDVILVAHRRERIRGELIFDGIVTAVVGLTVLVVWLFDKAVG